MTTFSHSGTTGDTFCSLVISKILGGGDFYLKLHNLENILPKKLQHELDKSLQSNILQGIKVKVK